MLFPATLAGAVVIAAGTAHATCHQPRMTGLSERYGTNCAASHKCGFVIAHWAGAEGCDHYNIRERSGSQFEAPGTNRGQLYNQRSAQFPGKFGPNNTIHVSAQGCTRNLFGKSSCTHWSNEVSLDIQPMASSSSSSSSNAARRKVCSQYATAAVAQGKLARETYKCDAATLSGTRWNSTFGQYFTWCMRMSAAARHRESAARTRIMNECRVKAAGPKGGKARIAVTSKGGDTFFITGSGFAPNAPVIIRLSGVGAAVATVTVANNQRITADAKGNISVRLFGAQICKRGGGRVTFTAEDQDNARSPPARATCAP
jgi:hypothetical protein